MKFRSIVALLLLLVTTGASTGAAAAVAATTTVAAQQGSEREVPVAVVRTPAQNGGTPDSLGQIADRNLGAAQRAQEIFDLNQGRRQADGGALIDGAVRPGWILILPQDAQGPDVQLARLNDTAQAPPGNGEDTEPTQGGGSDVTADTNVIADRLRWPIVLAVLGGLVVAMLTTVIVMRKRIRLNVRRLRTAIGALRAWVIARRQRRILLGERQNLIATWSYDLWVPGAAQQALANHQSVPAPVAVSVTDAGATVLGGPLSSNPDEQHHDAPVRSELVKTTRPIVRIGGNASEQVFVDLSQCQGVLSIDGDPALAQDVCTSLLVQLGHIMPEIIVLSLGPSSLPQSASVATTEDLQRFGLLPAREAPPRGLVNALAPTTALTGILLVQPGRPPAELQEAMARCAAPNSGWILIHSGPAVGAHWRWTVLKDGQLEVPMLDRTLTATGMSSTIDPPRRRTSSIGNSTGITDIPGVSGLPGLSGVPHGQSDL